MHVGGKKEGSGGEEGNKRGGGLREEGRRKGGRRGIMVG